MQCSGMLYHLTIMHPVQSILMQSHQMTLIMFCGNVLLYVVIYFICGEGINCIWYLGDQQGDLIPNLDIVQLWLDLRWNSLWWFVVVHSFAPTKATKSHDFPTQLNWGNFTRFVPSPPERLGTSLYSSQFKSSISSSSACQSIWLTMCLQDPTMSRTW